MKKLLYLLLLMLPLTMLCACDDDEPWENSGVPWLANFRLDFYNADGTPYEGLTADAAFKIKATCVTCEKDSSAFKPDYKDKHLYITLGDWSTHPHPGHEDSVTFKIGIKSKDLFGSDETKNITIVCDARPEKQSSATPVKSITSDNLTISSTLEYEKAEWYDGYTVETRYMVPVKIFLPEKE